MLDLRELEKRGEPIEKLVTHPLGDDPAKTISIGTYLSDQESDQLLRFLYDNADVFAWSPSDMLGIPSKVITHKLNVDPSFRPVRQKKRNFAPERQEAIKTEVDKLLTTGFIREVYYPNWLANVVMVK